MLARKQRYFQVYRQNLWVPQQYDADNVSFQSLNYHLCGLKGSCGGQHVLRPSRFHLMMTPCSHFTMLLQRSFLWFIEGQKRRTAFWKNVRHDLVRLHPYSSIGGEIVNCGPISCWCSMKMPPWRTWQISLCNVAWPSRNCHKKSCDCSKSLFLTMISLILMLVNAAVSALGMVAKVRFLSNTGHGVSLSGHIGRHALSRYYVSRTLHYILVVWFSTIFLLRSCDCPNWICFQWYGW